MVDVLEWIDDKLAVASMPSRDDVKELAKRFSAVVIVCEDRELWYDDRLWEEQGVRVYRVGTPDFRAPPLVSTFMALREVVKLPGKVLVHCVGGRGRSRSVAAAYLVHRYGVEPEEALRRVGGVETRAQEVFVEVYRDLLRVLGEKLVAVWNVGKAHGWGRGERHASYVAMHSVRLFKQLREPLKLREDLVEPLIVAALLHDVGVALGVPHEEHSYGILMNSRDLEALGEEVVRVAALVALHHRKRSDPRTDPRCADVRELVTPLAAILKVADALDHGLEGVVEDVVVDVEQDRIVLRLSCVESCDLEREKALKKSWLLEELTGKHIEIETMRAY